MEHERHDGDRITCIIGRDGERGAWLRCPDCASTVYEVWGPSTLPGRKTLQVEVEHSASCPVWPHEGRELALSLNTAEEAAAMFGGEPDA